MGRKKKYRHHGISAQNQCMGPLNLGRHPYLTLPIVCLMSHSTVPCAYSIYVNIHFYKFNCNSRFYYSQINVDKDDFTLTTEVIVDNFILKKHIINQNNYRDSLFTVEELWKKR